MRLPIIILATSILLIPEIACAQAGVADFYWPSWTGEPKPEDDPQQFENTMREELRVREELVDLDWKEADDISRIILHLNSDNPYLYHLEQYLAFHMLHKYLLARNHSTEKNEARAFYLELLLKNNTPDSYTIYKGLTLLDQYWSKEVIEEAAESTYESGKKWLLLRGAEIEHDEGVPQYSDPSMIRIWNMHQSLPKLKQLAGL